MAPLMLFCNQTYKRWHPHHRQPKQLIPALVEYHPAQEDKGLVNGLVRTSWVGHQSLWCAVILWYLYGAQTGIKISGMKWTKIVFGSSWAEIKPSLAVTTQQVWLRLPKYTFPLVTYIHSVNWRSSCYSIMEYHFLRIYASTPQNITFSEVSLATYILWQLRWVNQANNWVGWEILDRPPVAIG